MSEPRDTPRQAGDRRPRAFSPDDPALEVATGEPPADAGRPPQGFASGDDTDPAVRRPFLTDVTNGIGWWGVLVSATLALASLAAGIWFARFVSVAVARDDWVGWTAFALLSIAALAAFILIGRELVGLVRLKRLRAMRRAVDTALTTKDRAAEQSALAHLKALYGARPEMRWGLARLAEHQGDVRDPGDLLALADRELMAPLDVAARARILASAKRVATVTAMSPIAWIAVVYVAIENLRLLRALAGLYGGRPGAVGALRLARLVIGHIIATGGVALTDDLLGQFIGQDVLRRLSRRLGEGAFNGALTARVGVAGIEVCRPLPWLDSPPVRARDLAAELFRRTLSKDGKPKS